MAKYTASLTANSGSTYLCNIDRRKVDANAWQATVFIDGTFGSGTVTIQYSPDQGTTKITGKDFTGTALSATANAVFTTQPMGNGAANSDFISVYATMSGATSPSVSVILFDNR